MLLSLYCICLCAFVCAIMCVNNCLLLDMPSNTLSYFGLPLVYISTGLQCFEGESIFRTEKLCKNQC